MDGYRATHTIRTQQPFRDRVKDIPIVAMTASAIQGDKEKCQKAGMDDYLSKPVRANVLEKMLLKWTAAGAGSRRSSLAISRQQSLGLESDYSSEGGSGASRSQSPPLPNATFKKIPGAAHPHNANFQQPAGMADKRDPTPSPKSEALPDITKTRASNLSFIQNATLEEATDTDEARQQRRLQNEEKALSLRDAKMLSATEDPREQAHLWEKETRSHEEGPSHPLTPGNLTRHLSEQILKDEARLGKIKEERPAVSSSKESSRTVEKIGDNVMREK